MSKISFLEQLHQEKDSIQRELGCTEDEAWYALRHLASATPRGKALSITTGLIEMLEKYREEVREGETESFFRAIMIIGALGFPIPSWLQAKFRNAHKKYMWHEVDTLGEAFGILRPRFYRRDKSHEKITASFKIYGRCLQLQREGVKIGAADGGLFEIVGKEFHMSASKVREYYYLHATPSGTGTPHSRGKGRAG